jgi:hypothetical protein
MIRNLTSDQFIKKILYAEGFILFVYIIVGFWRYRFLPPQIPLFYSLPRSIDQLGFSWMIFFLPILSLIIAVLHGIAAIFLYKTERPAAYLLLIIALISMVLLLIGYLRIIFLIT